MAKYYLAYGSNLNIKQMAHRCPNAKPIGTSVIKDYQLLFKGSKTGAYLTIEKNTNSNVPVAVWEVTDNDEKRLDVYEGYPAFYYKTKMEVTVNHRKIKAFVYVMHEDRPLGIPSCQYVHTCADGYMDFGFGLKHLEVALKISKQEAENEND